MSARTPSILRSLPHSTSRMGQAPEHCALTLALSLSAGSAVARAPIVAANGRRITLAAVTAAHVAALLGAVLLAPAPARPVAPPAVVGFLVDEAEPATGPALRPVPTPSRAMPVPVRAASVTAPAPVAPVAAPPSVRAPMLEPTPEAATSSSAPMSAGVTPASSDESGIAALTPPSSDAAHLDNPKPVYPAASRRLKEEGRVVLEVFILQDGSVGDLRIKASSGHERLDQAAVAAVRHWTYLPARRGSTPIALWHTQSLLFSLVR